jgi:hypothetical protein
MAAVGRVEDAFFFQLMFLLCFALVVGLLEPERTTVAAQGIYLYPASLPRQW